MTEIPENTLYVKTFGSFSMRYNGRQVMGDARSVKSQSVRLLQMLLHFRDGVDLETLCESVLDNNMDIEDTRHAIHSIIYNTKRKLQSDGLPDVKYILVKGGIVRWNPEIPVIEDAEQFEQLCAKANEAADLDEKLQLYLQAIDLYNGEFMQQYTSQVWAAQQSKKYLQLFTDAMNSAVSLLRINKDYVTMRRIGLQAAKAVPLDEWETVVVESLISMGKTDDAIVYYQAIAEMYMRELGVRPSKQMLNMIERVGKTIKRSYAMLDSIQEELTGRYDDKPGGYLCSYPVFRGIYRMVERMIERGGQSVYLMLCTVVDTKGNPMKSGPALEELSERLGESIQKSIRHSDAVSRYSEGQYIILLVNTSMENCDVVQKRINHNFIVGYQRTGIHYYVRSVICEPDSVAEILPELGDKA